MWWCFRIGLWILQFGWHRKLWEIWRSLHWAWKLAFGSMGRSAFFNLPQGWQNSPDLWLGWEAIGWALDWIECMEQKLWFPFWHFFWEKFHSNWHPSPWPIWWKSPYPFPPQWMDLRDLPQWWTYHLRPLHESWTSGSEHRSCRGYHLRWSLLTDWQLPHRWCGWLASHCSTSRWANYADLERWWRVASRHSWKREMLGKIVKSPYILTWWRDLTNVNKFNRQSSTFLDWTGLHYLPCISHLHKSSNLWNRYQQQQLNVPTHQLPLPSIAAICGKICRYRYLGAFYAAA